MTNLARGSCLCGGVRYEVEEVLVARYCHCSRCRKWHGSPFAAAIRVPAASFRLVAGQELLSSYASSPGVARCFCKTCGSTLFTRRDDLGVVNVRMGSLDSDPGVRPSAHIFVGSKAEWFEITDDLPQFEEFPPQ